MPRYARFFRPAADDATHQKQLDSFIALGGDQQNFVLGSLLFDANSTLAALQRELAAYREENKELSATATSAMEQLEKLGELLDDGDDEDPERPLLERSDDEEVDAEHQTEDEPVEDEGGE